MVRHRCGARPGLAGDAFAGDFSGPTVCACYGVSRSSILAALASIASSREQVAARLKAGTGCGSCVPEIRRLLAAHG